MRLLNFQLATEIFTRVYAYGFAFGKCAIYYRSYCDKLLWGLNFTFNLIKSNEMTDNSGA